MSSQERPQRTKALEPENPEAMPLAGRSAEEAQPEEPPQFQVAPEQAAQAV